MGRKGASSGLKRKPAPRFWPIHRKEVSWVVKPTAGPHSTENCISLTIGLRDILGLAKTRKEAKRIASQGAVLVDGKIRKKDAFPVGLMDVISLPSIDKYFRILPSYKGLVLHAIGKDEAKFKLCRIEDRRIVNNGHVQLSFHDGSNILVKVADLNNPQEDVYETLDTLKISLPEKQILERIEMKEKNFAVITGGKNVGKHGKIVEIEKTEGKKRKNTLVTVEDERGNRHQTILNFIFSTGNEQSLITLLEAT